MAARMSPAEEQQDAIFRDRLAGAVARTLPISPTFDPRAAPDFRQLAAAAAALQKSVVRLRAIKLAQIEEYAILARELPVPRAKRAYDRLCDSEAAFAEELGYAAEALGALRIIVGGGR